MKIDTAFVSVFSLTLLFRLYQIDNVSLWFDEVHMFEVLNAGLRSGLEIALDETQPPLYYTIHEKLIEHFPHNIFLLRSVSLAAGVFFVLSVYVISREISTKYYSIILSTLFALLHPVISYKSIIFRPYSLILISSLLFIYSAFNKDKVTKTFCAVVTIFLFLSGGFFSYVLFLSTSFVILFQKFIKFQIIHLSKWHYLGAIVCLPIVYESFVYPHEAHPLHIGFYALEFGRLHYLLDRLISFDFFSFVTYFNPLNLMNQGFGFFLYLGGFLAFIFINTQKYGPDRSRAYQFLFTSICLMFTYSVFFIVAYSIVTSSYRLPMRYFLPVICLHPWVIVFGCEYLSQNIFPYMVRKLGHTRSRYISNFIFIALLASVSLRLSYFHTNDLNFHKRPNWKKLYQYLSQFDCGVARIYSDREHHNLHRFIGKIFYIKADFNIVLLDGKSQSLKTDYLEHKPKIKCGHTNGNYFAIVLHYWSDGKVIDSKEIEHFDNVQVTSPHGGHFTVYKINNSF